MMKLHFSSDGTNQVEPFQIVLCRRNLEKLGKIHNVSDIHVSCNYSEPQEISFTIHKTLDDNEELLWDEITSLRVVYVPQLSCYFQIEVDISTSATDITKSITGISLCEAELSQVNVYGLEINTLEDIENYVKLHTGYDYDDYIPTVFYNSENKEASLVDRLFSSFAPNYKIKHVDESLCSLQRSFEVDGVSLYDFLMGDFSEQFNCHIEFDSETREVSFYDAYSVCLNDECNYYLEKRSRYRGEFSDFCPKCGSRHIKILGMDTSILVSKDNLTEEVNFETDEDQIKNCLKLIGGDDLMSTTIASANITGDRLYYFSDEMYHDMSPALVSRIKSYNTLRDSYAEEYNQLMEDLYDAYDKQTYYQSSMMPTRTTSMWTSETEAANLTIANLSPVGVQDKTGVYLSTVQKAIENYAKCYIHSGYFKVEADGSYDGTLWTGTLTVTNYSDDKDVTITPILSIQITDDYALFLEQKCQKLIADNAKKKKEDNIWDVLNIKTISIFDIEIAKYSAARLQSFYDALEGTIAILAQYKGEAKFESEEQTLYDTYYTKMSHVNAELQRRNATVQQWTDEINSLTSRQIEIQNALDFPAYLGETLYNEFCSFRREDVYQNTNFISDLYLLKNAADEYDNAGLFAAAREFLEKANEDIYKSAQYQHSINTNLYNLLIMDEFKSIIDNFELGNFIRVRSDGDIYRLRLIHYEVDFNDLSTLNTEFSDMTKTSNGVNDVKSILDSAKQMASSYNHVQKQSDSGSKVNVTVNAWLDKGLDSSLYNIMNNESEEIVMDSNGIIAKSYDDISDSYLGKQLRITHNVIAFTDDNWATLRTAFGQFTYINENGLEREGYGVVAEAVLSGFIQGGTIVGSKLYSPHTSQGNATILDLESGDLSIGYDQMTYTASSNTLSINGGQIVGGSINLGSGTFIVDSNGNLTASSASITGTINASSGSIAGWNVSENMFICKNNARIWIDGYNGIFNGAAFQGGSVNINNNFVVDGYGNVTASNVSITGGSINIGYNGSYYNFSVDANGNAIATNFKAQNSIYLYPASSSSSGVYLTGNSTSYGRTLSVGTYSGGHNAGIECGGLVANGTINATSQISSSTSIWGYPVYSNGSQCITAANIGNYSVGYADYAGSVSWSDVSGAPTIPTQTPDISQVENANTNIKFSNSYTNHYAASTGWVGDNFEKKSSDERIKCNIADLNDNKINDIYMDLSPKEFDFKPNCWYGENVKHSYGLIAQDLIQTLNKHGIDVDRSQLIGTYKTADEDLAWGVSKYVNTPTYYKINYNELHAWHISMIQKQQEEIKILKLQNQNLQSQINLIMARITKLDNKS